MITVPTILSREAQERRDESTIQSNSHVRLMAGRLLLRPLQLCSIVLLTRLIRCTVLMAQRVRRSRLSAKVVICALRS